MSPIPAIRLNMNPKDLALLLLLSLTWSGSFFFMEVAVSELPVFTIVAARVCLGALTLCTFIYMRGKNLNFGWRVWRAFFVLGLIGQVIPFSLIVWGQVHITSGLASILNATVPFFTLLIAHVMTTDERITLKGVLGVLMGLVGIVVIIGPGAFLGSVNIFAQLAILLSSALYGLTTIYARRFAGMRVPPICVAAGQLTCSSLMLIPLTLFFDQPWALAMPSTGVLMALAGLGFVSTALAFIIYYHLISTVGGNNTSLVTFLVPVSAIWLGFTFLDEALVQTQIIGMGLIALGLLIIDGRVFRKIFTARK